MWAEDGTIFFAQDFERGATSLFDGYGGQLLLAHRSIALGASIFPLAWRPAIYVISAFAVTLACCSLVLSSRWCAPVSFPVRVVCLFALVSMPGTDEIMFTLTNIHWWLAVGVVILGLLDDPRSRLGRVAEAAFVIVVALTGFSALYGLPVLLFRWLRSRTGHARALLIAAGTGLFVQLGVLASSSRTSEPEQLFEARRTAVVSSFSRRSSRRRLRRRWSEALVVRGACELMGVGRDASPCSSR